MPEATQPGEARPSSPHMTPVAYQRLCLFLAEVSDDNFRPVGDIYRHWFKALGTIVQMLVPFPADHKPLEVAVCKPDPVAAIPPPRAPKTREQERAEATPPMALEGVGPMPTIGEGFSQSFVVYARRRIEITGNIRTPDSFKHALADVLLGDLRQLEWEDVDLVEDVAQRGQVKLEDRPNADLDDLDDLGLDYKLLNGFDACEAFIAGLRVAGIEPICMPDDDPYHQISSMQYRVYYRKPAKSS